MPLITFQPSNTTGEIAQGTTILDAAVLLGVGIRHDCGGVASCGTCLVRVSEGVDNLSEREQDELDCLEDYGIELVQEHRLACQTQVNGDATVTVVNPE